jgi:hypothetical protein
MSRSKPASKSGPTTIYGRQIVYDREIFISICRKILLGQDLQTICAKPPMPIGQVFLGWVQDHPEARAIYRSVNNFRMDRGLAREVGVITSIAAWEEQVRANCERGWPADWIERKYIPPDWNKVYPLLGGPPVWSTEDIEAYTELLNGFTEMLEPRDMIELMWTKDAADATWEAGRNAREKNALPERKYQQRLKVLAEVQRRNRAAETTAAKPATALDHSRGLEAGFKYYQALDIAQSRALKRRDNALCQIARWRDGPGAKARRLSDKFVAEHALAESYCATQSLAYAEIDDPVGEAREAAPPLAPVGDAADIAPAVPPSDATAADIAPAVPTSEETAADIAPAVPPSDETAADIAPAAPTSEETAADIAPAVPTSDEAAEAAPPRAPADDEPINWVGWLTGAEKYTWVALSNGAHKDFKQPCTSKKWLVQNLVVDRKVIRPDQVCPELAQYLPAIAEAAPTVAASAEAPK